MNQITNFQGILKFCAIVIVLHATAYGQVSINEFLASNVANIADPQYNEYSDWIELYNAGAASVNISGWYLADQQGTVPGWRLPANTIIQPRGFLLIWADGRNTGLHTDFKLSAGGEEVVLYDDQSVMKDDIIFDAQKQDISYGRKTNGGTPWGLFTSPTPGSSNNNSRFYSSSVEQVPVFSISGGFYNGPVNVLIEDLYPKGTIRYTLDGSEPTDNSPVFSLPLSITKTTVVRARMFYTDQIPGPVITNTYFINEHFDERRLPVLSLSTKPDYFYGKDSGLYVQNFKPDWEYPIHLEFYQKDGIFGFHHDAGVQIGGLNAWILPQKLLNIYSRKVYGAGHFDFQLFNAVPRKQYGDFILRCSGNDWSNTFFRDGMMQGLIKDYADLDGQSFRPVSVFINGQYLGMHNLREKQDADYCQFYHGIDPDSLDYIENNTEIKEGNLDRYNQMVTMLNAGVVADAAFNRLDSVMDTHNYTDYIISQIFTANTSWGHNVSCFRNRGLHGRWRWLLHDYDRGFDLANVTGTGMSWATATNGQDYSNPAWATLFLRKMLENNAYRQSFITRFADHLFVTYHPSTITAKVMYHADLVRGEMPYQIERWKGTTSSYGNAIPTLSFWENEVNKLVQYGQQRNTFMWSDLNSFFGLSSTTGLTVSLSKPQAGYVKIHDLKIPSYPWSGQYFQKRDITLTAFAKSGYQFDHWERVITRDTVLLAAGSKWKYRDVVTAPPSDWISNTYNDNNWSSGNAELGYGDGDEVTVISYGSDANNKIPSYYFRSYFNVKDASSISDLILRIKADDGAVAYINGKEAGRINMPASPIVIGFDTLALSSVSGTAESSFTELSVPVSLLKNGTNLIAVEVHQANRSSSDVSFDAEVIVRTTGNSMFLSNKTSYTFQLDSSHWNVSAVFNPDGHCGVLPDSIIENTTLTASCSPYIASGNVFVKQGIHLVVEKGVEIRFPAGSSLFVNGDIQINGTPLDPVLIRAISDSVHWGGIFLQEPTAECQMQYLRLVGAGAGTDRTYFPAAISAYRATLRMDHLNLTQVTDNPVFSRFSHVELTNSDIKTSVTGDGINIKQGYGRVENCIFEGGHAVDMDAIDYDGVQGGIVKNNIIHDFRGDNNDGLDIGEHCENLMIENNFIYHCYDKGISVGQRSSATVRNNAIAYTSIGIALKDQSPVLIDHCTFFGNQQEFRPMKKMQDFLEVQVRSPIVLSAMHTMTRTLQISIPVLP
ncbi:MAG: CotH kinase family protein [Saprospiraceae bacterium]